jgi:hypothetical protein
MTERVTIRGEATLGYVDYFATQADKIIKFCVTAIMLSALVYAIAWAASSSDEEWFLLRHDPLSALAAFAGDVWKIWVVTGAVICLIPIASLARGFHHFPDVNRRLSYEADDNGLTIRDAANFALTIPWSAVIRVRFSKRLLKMQLTTRAWRYVLWRAFRDEDRERLMRLAERAPLDGRRP